MGKFRSLFFSREISANEKDFYCDEVKEDIKIRVRIEELLVFYGRMEK